MKTMKYIITCCVVLLASAAMAQDWKTAIPKFLTTPDKIETRLGALEFFDGYPSHDTVQKCYDNLLFMRGVEVFLNWLPAASISAAFRGNEQAGLTHYNIVSIYENNMDSTSINLTPNMDSVYAVAQVDLREGPIVVESPPNTLGMFQDFFFRYVADMGNAGPDRGEAALRAFRWAANHFANHSLRPASRSWHGPPRRVRCAARIEHEDPNFRQTKGPTFRWGLNAPTFCRGPKA